MSSRSHESFKSSNLYLLRKDEQIVQNAAYHVSSNLLFYDYTYQTLEYDSQSLRSKGAREGIDEGLSDGPEDGISEGMDDGKELGAFEGASDM